MRKYVIRLMMLSACMLSLAMPKAFAEEKPAGISAGKAVEKTTEQTTEDTTQSVKAEILAESVPGSTFELQDIQADDNIPVSLINNNIPDFYIWQVTSEPYVALSPLDELKRTGSGMACLGKETIPTEARGQIGDIRPSGWHTVRYDDLIEDHYLFNRSHVLGYQLSGDNATPENLFTGTRYLNAESMLFFENRVMDYLEKNGNNHVVYRVSPVYHEKDLVPTGVQMEAFSVEDYGKGICFNVFLYNIQPGIRIDYATGESERDPKYDPDKMVEIGEAYRQLTSRLAETKEAAEAKTAAETQAAEEVLSLDAIPAETAGEMDRSSVPFTETAAAPETKAPETKAPETEAKSAPEQVREQTVTYILNTNTHKFHYPNCSSVNSMKDKNKKEFYGSRDEAIADGYSPCGRCHP